MQLEIVAPVASAPRRMILLGSMGDLELTWEAHNDEEWREVIAKKMSEGVTFFAIKTEAAPMARRSKLGAIGDLPIDVRTVSIPDKDILRFVSEGKAEVRRTRGRITHSQKITDPAVAASSETAALPALQGG